MDKSKKKKNLKRTLCGLSLTGGFLVGNSLYNYHNIDYVYDDLKNDTIRKIESDYSDYNRDNNISLYDPITAYDMYVSEVASLLRDVFKLDNPDHIFMFFCYMKNNGYLSVNREFNYGSPSIDIYGKKGINVVLGTAFCEHESEFFMDILKKMGFDCYKIVGFTEFTDSDFNMFTSLDYETISYYSKLSRLREISILPILNLKDGKNVPNHVFNGVLYNGKAYYYDTSNLLKWVYDGDGLWHSLSIDSKNRYKIKYSSIYTKIENDIGNLLDFSSDDKMDECKIIYEQLYMGEYDMIFEQWYSIVSSEFFDSIKTFYNIKGLGR